MLELPNSYSEIHDMVNIHENTSSLQTVHLRISFLFLGQYKSCLSSSRSGICPEKGIYSSRPQVANQLTLQEVHLQALQTYNVTELSISLHITRKLTLILKFSKIQVGCKALIMADQFKIQDYYNMITNIIQELPHSKPGDLFNERF